MGRANKYGAHKIMLRNVQFDSKREGWHYLELLDRQERGEIRDLTLQPRFVIIPAFKDRTGKKHKETVYTADFQYVEVATGQVVVEDVKSVATQKARDFGLRWKLAILGNPTIEFRLVK